MTNSLRIEQDLVAQHIAVQTVLLFNVVIIQCNELEKPSIFMIQYTFFSLHKPTY